MTRRAHRRTPASRLLRKRRRGAAPSWTGLGGRVPLAAPLHIRLSADHRPTVDTP
jgi:hypothetical protein